MDARQQAEAGPSNAVVRSPLQTKEPQNEACTACRAVKRKCIHSDGPDKGVCRRCQRLGLECEYKQLKRGRKSGDSKAKRLKREGTSEDDTADSMSKASPAVANQHDWLYQDILQQDALASPATLPPPAASMPALPPLPAGPTRPNAARHVLPGLNGLHRPDGLTFHPANGPHVVGVTPGTSPHSVVVNEPPGHSVAPTPPNAPITPGGFSLGKLLAAKPAHGEQPPKHSLAAAFAVGDEPRPPVQHHEFRDLVELGIVPFDTVLAMFEFYFAHLNPMTSLLDPALHTIQFCRTRSAFLFSAILCSVAKVRFPHLYPAATRALKSLLGQAFEHGVHDIDLVQALALYAFWAEATDDTGAKKVAYAIRCAFELGCHKRAKRPLPDNELDARLILNKERTWAYLSIADHRYSTQRSLPRMIPSNLRYDAVQWMLEHPKYRCPSDAGLGPLIALGRLLDLYLALVNPENGEVPNSTLLECLETDFAHWSTLWTGPRAASAPIVLHPCQLSLVRFYVRLFRFQLDEVHLLISIKAPPPSDQLYFEAKQSPALTFNRCVKSAIRVLESLREELDELVILYDSQHIGAASAAIWLAQNIGSMEHVDRQAVVSNLAESSAAALRKSTDAQSMAAVTSRLFEHLLRKARQTVADASVAAAAAAAGPAQSEQQPQQQGQPQRASGELAVEQQQVNSNALATHDQSSSWGALGDLAAMGPSLLMTNYFADQGAQTSAFFGGVNGNPFGDDMAYPEEDDSTWQRLFPFFGNSAV